MKWMPMVLAVAFLNCVSGPLAPETLSVAQQALVDAGAQPCPSDAGTCVETSSKQSLDGGCSNERWVATLPEGHTTCPAPSVTYGGVWRATRLFEEPAPPGLRGYCVYEWAPHPAHPWGPHLPSLAALDSVLSSRAVDCAVVAPLGSAATAVTWQSLRTSFREQTGWLSSLPRASGAPPAPVRVAVVDAAPHVYAAGQAVDDRSGHGEAVGQLIRDLSCPSAASATSACVGQVSNHLALPQLSLRTLDLTRGGYFGYYTQLARALHSAVNDWQAYNAVAAVKQPRLVVNLSVAWEPTYGGDYAVPGDLDVPIRAVQQAIVHAVCRGALVVSAAGNAPLGPEQPTGPMFPARWETHPAPNLQECERMEGVGYAQNAPLPLFAPVGVYAPLLHAVAAVRADDSELSSSREGGRSRLAAPGAHAVAESATFAGRPTSVLTGSSAAAAVASGVATALWGYRPQLSSHEVMALVRQGGVSLGAPAEFCTGGAVCPLPLTDSRRTIHRVNLCGALAAACGGGLELCPPAGTLATCSARGAYAGVLPAPTATERAALDKALTGRASAAQVAFSLPGLEACSDVRVYSHRPSYPGRPCPQRQFYGETYLPWTAPQPGDNPCPDCLFEFDPVTLTGRLTLSIDLSYSGTTLMSPVLTLDHEVDVNLATVGRLTGGETLGVEDIVLPQAPTRATLSFSLVDARGDLTSTSSELRVYVP